MQSAQYEKCKQIGMRSTAQGDGHASIILTLDVYSHVLPDMQKAATDKLENLLFKRTGTL